VFLVSWYTQCSLQYPTGKTLKLLVKSGERGGYSAPPKSYASSGETPSRKFLAGCGNAVRYHLVESNSPQQKTN
jgi:hypothetical protein